MKQALKILGVFLSVTAIICFFFSLSFSKSGNRERKLSLERETYALKQGELCFKYNIAPEKTDTFLQVFKTSQQRGLLTGVSHSELQSLLVCMVRKTGCSGVTACRIFNSSCRSLCLTEYSDDICESLARNDNLIFKNSDGRKKNFSEILAMLFVKSQTIPKGNVKHFADIIVGSIDEELFLGLISSYPEAEKMTIDSLLAGYKDIVADFISARDNYSDSKEFELNGLVNQRLNYRKWCILVSAMFSIFAATAFILSAIQKTSRN